MRVFFVVLARDASEVEQKASELDNLGYPYLIVCGEKTSLPNVVYRAPKGKYDAINFGFRFVPKDVDIVALNDVDTKINNLEAAMRMFRSADIGVVFAKVVAEEGPQNLFLNMLRKVRRILPVSASGDLMLVRYEALEKALPIKRCKAEDSYLYFKILELGYKTVDCEECYVKGEKTKIAREEQDYKRRTVTGIYQALRRTNPPILTRLFYVILPFASPILIILGGKGLFWMKGIILGFTDYLRGDTSGTWQKTMR
jgi:cellulose synthase/poly-beta-1,6-N-acetylglucosamine synthase-like glycosyltransferase